MEDVTRYLITPTVTEEGVAKVWEETVVLPTYPVGEEEKNPIFLEKRVYQGSSGAVYPYAVVEKLSDEKTDRPYRAVFLENEYIKVMVLPELGGRLHMAYDKVRCRHFVYYNQVIKPALVGLTGPWISGGIEFNWPQHHRPGTFLPTEYCTEVHPDGSVTVWCSEIERMSRTKGTHGFTLYPGRAYVEVNVKVCNRTPFPQTFLWWANPAVVVNDDYHSVFPPDVHAVFDHGKRDVSSFPIATGVYYKHDYSPGTDISKYKNIPVPTSYMAVESKYDFVGGYDQGARAGLLHVADRHRSPGKKQWTWGCGDFGRAWDRNLTDEDGPYIELMTGVYTDNQPDFSWLQPGEEKSWTQYFMPYAEVGYVKNASRDAVVNIEAEGGKARIVLYTTSRFTGLRIVLRTAGGKVLSDETADVSPGRVYKADVATGGIPARELILTVYDAGGREMLSYRPEEPGGKAVPEPAKAALRPEEIATTEQLYLTGLHLEQYRHATYSPADYYGEALRREPGDVRCNNAMGLLMMRKGRFEKAEPFFRRAVETLTRFNPNPYDGEPYYNLGWSLRMQGRPEEAYEAFYKATWNAAWQDAGFLALAQTDCSCGRWEAAADKAYRSMVRNWHNHKSRHLRTAALRRAGKSGEALALIEESLAVDLFNMGCRFEKYLISGEEGDLSQFLALMAGNQHTFIEYSLDYAAAGLYEEARKLLSFAVGDGERVYPMVYYTLGYLASCSGEGEMAIEYYAGAMRLPADGCFPNRIEEVNILHDALRVNPSDSRALYYLGNFWYAARQYDEAVSCWEQSQCIDGEFPPVLRNLALAYYNKCGRKAEARELLEKAFALDNGNARMLMELDQLYRKTGVSPAARLELLEDNLPLVEQRDDLRVERIALHNRLGNYSTAMELASARQFHPWEGGEGRVTRQYVICRVELAKKALAAGDYREALRLLHETDSYPHNLGEGKLATAEENDIHYLKGMAYRAAGDEASAVEYFRKATEGSSEPQQAFFYNDPRPDVIYYLGRAWEALGRADKAGERYRKLVEYGRSHMEDECRIDYFAVSLPDLAIWEEDLDVRNRIHCNYVIGLGLFGLGDSTGAEKYFDKVLELDVNHIDAWLALRSLKNE
ncbi:MAG: DUF5107 domain-containing protein [Alistipes sp.]|nr:DUF5107 domain-containing protein [Alistipes sp.]